MKNLTGRLMRVGLDWASSPRQEPTGRAGGSGLTKPWSKETLFIPLKAHWKTGQSLKTLNQHKLINVFQHKLEHSLLRCETHMVLLWSGILAELETLQNRALPLRNNHRSEENMLLQDPGRNPKKSCIKSQIPSPCVFIAVFPVT